LCDEAPRKIISKCIDDTVEPETVVSMPSYSADRQAIHRAKAKARPVYPPKPSKLCDIELPEFLKHAISRRRAEDGTEMDGETFLLHDSGVNDEDRFFMFGTEANVSNLEMSEIYADGTFSIAPNLFLQVYTIHCVVHGRCLPMVYCLLPRKTAIIYEKMLRDFELALIKAVRNVWPNVTIYLCFFHFKQSMWRKIQELGLAGSYKSDESVRKLLKLPQILAFVPVADVQDLFHDIKRQLLESTSTYKAQIIEFYEYFERYYVGGIITAKKTRGRKPRVPKPDEYVQPMFSIDQWSVHSRIIDQISRTNNFTEAWHNSFSTMLSNHPLVYSLVDSFRKEQKLAEDNLIRLNAGIQYKRKPAYVLLDEQLIFAVNNYSKVKFSDYYTNINNIVSY